jgi:RNA polymerase subunit RPABC4/transcription elongation factor Spt4
MDIPQLEDIGKILLAAIAFASAFTVAFWMSLVIWTFRDMRLRSRDIFAQILASLVVLIFGPLGMLIYLILRPQETLSEAYARTLEEEALLQDITEEQPVCPECKHRIEPDFIICPACHTELRKACPNCGRLMLMRWEMCPYCAEPYPLPPEPERSPELVKGELDIGLEAEPGVVEEFDLEAEPELEAEPDAGAGYDLEALPDLGGETFSTESDAEVGSAD